MNFFKKIKDILLSILIFIGVYFVLNLIYFAVFSLCFITGLNNVLTYEFGLVAELLLFIISIILTRKGMNIIRNRRKSKTWTKE